MIYFIKNKQTGNVKIGVATRSVHNRMVSLQREVAAELELLAVFDGDRHTERAFHDLFDHARVWREWFRPTPLLADLCAALGVPNSDDPSLDSRSIIRVEIDASIRALIGQCVERMSADRGERATQSAAIRHMLRSWSDPS